MSGSARARVLRRKTTWAEKLMWSWLRGRRFKGWKFRRQHPSGPYTLDFFCAEATLAVELDGFQHGFRKGQEHDAKRDSFLREQGIEVLRFWNSTLRRDAKLIQQRIYKALIARAPFPANDLVQCGKQSAKTVALTLPSPPGRG